MFLSINARHHLQVRSIGCSGLQNGCKWHYHTADSVLTSRCSFIIELNWIIICIMLAMLGIYIKRKIFSTGKNVCEYTYPAGKLRIWESWAPAGVSGTMGGCPGRAGIPCQDVFGSGVGCLRQSRGDALVAWCLQHVCRFLAVPFWHGWHHAVWFWWSVAGWLSIAAFLFLCPGDSTPRFFSSSTLAWGILIRYCVSSIVACKNLPLAIFAIFKARHMLDCSSCTRPTCLAIVADMLTTYKKLVAALTMRVGYYLDYICFCSLL